MNNFKWLDLLKFRISYGELGNQNIGNYPYISSISLGQGVLNNNIVSVAAQNNVANREISWESSKILNFGLNAAFLASKLNIEFDYYIKNTDDILPLVALTEHYPVAVRFIEEMPFNGEGLRPEQMEFWSYKRIMDLIRSAHPELYKLQDEPSYKKSTSKL